MSVHKTYAEATNEMAPSKKGKHNPTKLTAPHKAWIYVAIALVFVSGSILIFHRYFIMNDKESPIVAWVPWLLKIHGAGAMLSLMVFGSLIKPHLLRNWKDARNRRTGLIMGGCFSIMIITAYMLYYVSDPAIRLGAVVVHEIVGFGLPLLVVAHVYIGKKFYPKE